MSQDLHLPIDPAARSRLDRPLPPGPVTYEEFLDWCDEDTCAEWAAGEIVLASPASWRHQQIAFFLAWLLQSVAERSAAGQVTGGPFQMRLAAPINRGREPDVLFVRTDHANRWRGTYLDGPADLVIEVISPESRERDRVTKYQEYEAAGIPEYWLIDPIAEWADLYQLGPAGHYQPVFSGRTGQATSRVLPELRFPIEWLWQDPLPRQRDVLHELDHPAAP